MVVLLILAAFAYDYFPLFVLLQILLTVFSIYLYRNGDIAAFAVTCTILAPFVAIDLVIVWLLLW